VLADTNVCSGHSAAGAPEAESCSEVGWSPCDAHVEESLTADDVVFSLENGPG
jgi:hypothetical protein